MANETFSSLYDQKTAELSEVLYGSGAADGIIEAWVTVLSSSAGDLVSSDDVASDAAAITEYINSTLAS